MHNNYEIVCVEEDRIFIVPCPVHDLENFLRREDLFDRGSYFPGMERTRFPRLEKIIEELQSNLSVEISKVNCGTYERPISKMGSKRVVFGYKHGEKLLWNEVVLLGHTRNKHPGISGGGGLIRGAFCEDLYLSDYHEHVPKQEITGFPSSSLFNL